MLPFDYHGNSSPKKCAKSSLNLRTGFATSVDLVDTLDELEADLLPQERKAWLEAFDRVAT
jgi:hypothetical protein